MHGEDSKLGTMHVKIYLLQSGAQGNRKSPPSVPIYKKVWPATSDGNFITFYHNKLD